MMEDTSCLLLYKNKISKTHFPSVTPILFVVALIVTAQPQPNSTSTKVGSDHIIGQTTPPMKLCVVVVQLAI